jgi:hypothetical protein
MTQVHAASWLQENKDRPAAIAGVVLQLVWLLIMLGLCLDVCA